MKKELILLCIFFTGAGCLRKESNAPVQTRNDFDLFNRITVSTTLPEGTQCLLYTENPTEGTEPVMVAYAPFVKELKVAKAVKKLWFYANGTVQEFDNRDISISSTVAAGRAGELPTPPADQQPLAVDWVTFSEDFLSAINAFYP